MAAAVVVAACLASSARNEAANRQVPHPLALYYHKTNVIQGLSDHSIHYHRSDINKRDGKHFHGVVASLLAVLNGANLHLSPRVVEGEGGNLYNSINVLKLLMRTDFCHQIYLCLNIPQLAYLSKYVEF